MHHINWYNVTLEFTEPWGRTAKQAISTSDQQLCTCLMTMYINNINRGTPNYRVPAYSVHSTHSPHEPNGRISSVRHQYASGIHMPKLTGLSCVISANLLGCVHYWGLHNGPCNHRAYASALFTHCQGAATAVAVLLLVR